MRESGRRSKLRPEVRATERKARYTSDRRPAHAPVEAGADSGYEAGYKTGYEAGLAAARKQLEGDSANARLTGRDSGAAAAGENSFRTRVPSAAEPAAAGDATDRTTAQRSLKSLGMPDAIETETLETPPLEETASLHLNGAGMPASLRGSLASLERQNARLETDGLERILDEADLSSRIENKLLVPLPASTALTVNPDLIENHRYCRPWTARFLADLARAHAAAFHKPIEVSSAVRTVEYQKRLMNTNGNAAAAEGDVVSPHLTGATVDIAKQGLSRQEMAWMRRQLLGLEQAGKIDVEEEFQQACFHITVYKSYAPARAAHKSGEPVTGGTGTRRKAAQPATEKPGSQLPADLAAGVFPSQGR